MDEMILDGPFSQSDWNSAVSQFADLNLLQTWEYAEAASRTRGLEVHRLIFEVDGKVIGAAQGFVRTIPYIGGGAALINRGPLWQRDGASPSTLAAILSALRDYWVGRRGMYLRVAPAMRTGEVPQSLFPEAGYDSAEHSHPWISARLDLSDSTDTLRRSLRSNWSASLKKAESAGIKVEWGPEKTLLNDIRTELEQLTVRKRFASPVTSAFLGTFQDLADDRHRLWSLTARQASWPLGGIALARYGSVCEYLVGAVNDEGKRLNAGQLLLWAAVMNAKDSGYRWFDLGGMDPEATPKGILYFKSGLNAKSYELMGDFEACSPGLINKAIRWKLERALRHMSSGAG
jgi:lipid II:glycine glycyltransferase (peptidoglycan interpeptide bridge formation enzyme)